MRIQLLKVIGTTGALIALLFSSEQLQAQTVEQILRDTKARAASRAASINNYTLVVDIGGTESTQYYEKQMSDGFPVFVPRPTASRGGARGRASGRGSGAEAEDLARLSSGLFTSQQALQRARHEGNETVDGKRTHKIVISDLGSIDVVRQMIAGANERVTPKTMTVFIDAAQYVPLKIIVVADANVGGRTTEMTITQLMQDYRTVDGFLYPFKSVTMTEGLGAAMQISPEQMEQVRKMIAQLPPDQRAQAEQAMGMMGGAASGGEIVVVTKSLRVNTGPPGG